MDYNIIIPSIITFLTTIFSSWLVFRGKLEKIEQERNNSRDVAINITRKLLFEQIQQELTRRDQRISELEVKLDDLELDEEKRKELLESERTLNRKISVQLENERHIRIQLENDFVKLKERVLYLEKENTKLKRKLKKLETGELG